MKLAAGEARIFTFAAAFRNRERGALHHPAFTMLEWYRAQEPYERLMDDCTALLRMEAGRHPRDAALTQLIGELSTRSEEFRTLWARHDVTFHRSGRKRIFHPAVGVLDLEFEGMELPSDPDLTLLVYAVQPGSPTADKIALLELWADEQEALGAGYSSPAGGWVRK